MCQEPFCIYYLDHITSLQGPTSLRACEYFQTKVLILLIQYTRYSEQRLKTRIFRIQISRRLYIIAAKPCMESVNRQYGINAKRCMESSRKKCTIGDAIIITSN